jgi:hypothetical protein
MCDHSNREVAMVVLYRDETGKPTVWCDPCIAPLIKALNDGGIGTLASCCGHGEPERLGWVMLADDRVLHIHPDLNAAHDALTLHTVDAGRTKCGCQSCEIRATKAGRRRPEEL